MLDEDSGLTVDWWDGEGSKLSGKRNGKKVRKQKCYEEVKGGQGNWQVCWIKGWAMTLLPCACHDGGICSCFTQLNLSFVKSRVS